MLVNTAKLCYGVGMTHQLDSEVRALLDARRGDWKAIADGSGVSYSWLSKFFNEHIDNPGYGTLTKLHAYLTKDRVSPPGAPEVAGKVAA